MLRVRWERCDECAAVECPIGRVEALPSGGTTSSEETRQRKLLKTSNWTALHRVSHQQLGQHIDVRHGFHVLQQVEQHLQALARKDAWSAVFDLAHISSRVMGESSPRPTS